MRFIEFVEVLARVADKAITRKTQEFIGRDPSTSGVAGAIEGTGNTPGASVISPKKGTNRGASELISIAGFSRSKSNPRDKSIKSKKFSKAPSLTDGKSIAMRSDISDPIDLPIGKEITHLGKN